MCSVQKGSGRATRQCVTDRCTINAVVLKENYQNTGKILSAVHVTRGIIMEMNRWRGSRMRIIRCGQGGMNLIVKITGCSGHGTHLHPDQ